MPLYVSAALDVGLALDRVVLLAAVWQPHYAEAAADALAAFYGTPARIRTRRSATDVNAGDVLTVVDGSTRVLIAHTWTREDADHVAAGIAERFRIETLVRPVRTVVCVNFTANSRPPHHT